ncbi:MAG: tape measure protein [Alcanivorax sp.]
MTETARLVLAVDSREVDRGQRSLDGLTDKSRRAEQETERLTRATDQLGGAYRGLRNVLAAVGIGVAIRAVVQASDTYSELRSQLRLVTESQEELNDTYEAAYKLAQDTRGGLGETINLYARLARSSEELDLTNQQLLTVTRAINQSFVVSGASAQEAASATLQLSQGMASGTLRGEELNSVLENSPRLARAIADGLGVTIGQLRELGAEGQLTGSAVTRALLSSADSINREFQDMPRTVGQSLQQLRNDLIDTFGETDVSGFNDAIDDLRELVTDPNFKESVVTLGTAFATLIGTMASGASEVVNFTEYLGAELASKINGVAADDIPRLERELAGLEKQLDASFLEKDIGLVFTSDEEIKRKIEEVRERLQIAYDLQQSFNQGFGNNKPDQGGGDPPEPLGGGGDDKATKSIQKRVAALQLEAETLGMTARQEELYRARKEGATAAQLAAIEGSYRQIEAYEAEQKALEEKAEFERALERDLGEIQDRYASERELLAEDLMLRRETILESYELGKIDRQEANALLQESNREYYDELDALRSLDIEREQKASQMVTSARLAAAQQGVGLLQFFARENEAVAHVVLGVQTALSAAMAWTNTLVAATRAVAELGPIAGPPAAASIMAWGKLQVGLIAATGLAKGFMGGAGGGSPSGAGGGFGGSPEAAPPSPLPPRESNSGGNLTIVFQGDVTGFDQDELADTLLNKMGDEINNLDRVVIDPRSRNGRMLRGR